MPLAARHRDDPSPELEHTAGLVVRREESAVTMAALQGRSEEEMSGRFRAGHRAYVARWQGEPAGWGWVATRNAEIGELRSSFAIPEGERYLWNFVTLKTHRGRGIYPRLLDAIVRVESREAERFWIAYAPENHASGSGIRKAGFVTLAELSFSPNGQPAVTERVQGGGVIAARVLGLPVANGVLSPCWRCVRAAALEVRACSGGGCRCDYQRPELGCAA